MGKNISEIIEGILSSPVLDINQRQQIINKAIEFLEEPMKASEMLLELIMSKNLTPEQYDRVILCSNNIACDKEQHNVRKLLRECANCIKE